MKIKLTRIRLIVKAWQVRRIDRQYAELGRGLEIYSEALSEAHKNAHLNRVALMLRRARLRAEIGELGAQVTP